MGILWIIFGLLGFNVCLELASRFELHRVDYRRVAAHYVSSCLDQFVSCGLAKLGSIGVWSFCSPNMTPMFGLEDCMMSWRGEPIPRCVAA